MAVDKEPEAGSNTENKLNEGFITYAIDWIGGQIGTRFVSGRTCFGREQGVCILQEAFEPWKIIK